MRHVFSKASSGHKKHRSWLSTLGGLSLLAATAAINPGFAHGEMKITDMTMFRENASSTCVPFRENHQSKNNYVQYEANLFKSALQQSRTFREIAEKAEKVGLHVDYICHSGEQFRPASIDLDHASLTVNLLREEINRPYEALLSTHYLFRMRAAELQGAARNPEFTPEDQLKAYMVQYADAVAWTGLAAAESALEKGTDTDREFALYKKIFPGPAQAITAALAKMPKDGKDHYDEMKGEILKAGFMAGLADDNSRSWVANNGLPRWLAERLGQHPEQVASAATHGFTGEDVKAYGAYLDGLDVDFMYDTLYGDLADDPAAPGLEQMQQLVDTLKQVDAEVRIPHVKRPANTP